jgi:uncharacterized membrane protein
VLDRPTRCDRVHLLQFSAATFSTRFSRDKFPFSGGEFVLVTKSQSDIQRLSALSDGIFAVAMTLLTFNVHLPPSSAGPQLSQELLRMSGEAAGLLLSFAIAAMFWISHLRIFQMLQRADFGFGLLNFVLLLSIVLLPISTSVSTSFPQTTAAKFVFGGNLVLISLMTLSLWVYGLSRRLLVMPSLYSRQSLLESAPLIFSTLIFSSALLAMLLKPWLGPYLWSCAFASPLIRLLAKRRFGSAPQRGRP